MSIMKNINHFYYFFLFTSSLIYSQSISKFELKDRNGPVPIVVELDEKEAQLMNDRAKDFFMTNYLSSIEVTNRTPGKIELHVLGPKGLKRKSRINAYSDFFIEFDMLIEFKENKYRLSIPKVRSYEISPEYKANPNNWLYQPGYLHGWKYYFNKKGIRKDYRKIIPVVEDYLNQISLELSHYIKTGKKYDGWGENESKQNKKDDW